MIRNASPLIVCGCQSSGTTLAASILSAHPRAAFGVEDGVIRLAVKWFADMADKPGGLQASRLGEFSRIIKAVRSDDKKYAQLCTQLKGIIAAYACNGFLAEMVARNDVNGCVRQLCFDVYAKGAPEKWDYWGDKYPEYLFQLAEIDAIFPEARYLFVVRHPFAVIGSLAQRRGWTVNRVGDVTQVNIDEYRWSLADCRDQWINWNRQWLAFDERSNELRCLQINYEDLLTDAADTVGRIEEFLGVALTKAPEVQKQLSDIDPARSENWMDSELVEEILDLEVSRELRELADEFGYDLSPGAR
jgi:hypothetical protein